MRTLCPGTSLLQFRPTARKFTPRSALRQERSPAPKAGAIRQGVLSVPVESSQVLIAAAACFAAVSIDVFQTHILLGRLDNLCHTWVVDHIPPEVRKTTADVLISDTFYTIGLVGWAVASAAILVRRPKGGVLTLLLASAIYLSSAGAVTKGDPPVVQALKGFFHRARPSTLHSTFSFPSGHTTAASFLVGACIFVLVPTALAGRTDAAPLQAPPNDDASAQADVQEKSIEAQAASTALAIWIVGTATTAVGRILADAHWLSDTMAGAALGTMLVSILSRFSRTQQAPR